ncbi:MAG: metallophosphoesterase [Candidatus Omnitrophica bacterium]|nr:metallophosphoesterase [Candidatus Omnitrophota bacterium]
MRTLVIGDIHGQYEALYSVLLKSGFRNQEERLIVLGDIYDGVNPECCIDFLFTIKHLVCVMGNHDQAVMDAGIREGISDRYISFIDGMRPYFEENGLLFIHGGFDPRKPFAMQDIYDFNGSRTLPHMGWEAHQRGEDFIVGGFNEVYVGHTRTQIYGFFQPLKLGNLWMMDTGAAPGCGGYLSVMDIKTKEFWQVKCS